jgi:hypothetical protein
MECFLKILKFFGYRKLIILTKEKYPFSLSKNKVNTFVVDKPKFSDFKSYVKEFYYIVNFYENYQNNIVFCGLNVNYFVA